jgi:hypothetical protein
MGERGRGGEEGDVGGPLAQLNNAFTLFHWHQSKNELFSRSSLPTVPY